MARLSSVLLAVVAALVLLLTIHGEEAHHEVVEDKTSTERFLRAIRCEHFPPRECGEHVGCIPMKTKGRFHCCPVCTGKTCDGKCAALG